MDSQTIFNYIQKNNLLFLNGKVDITSYHYGQVDEETKPILNTLISLNELGMLTTCSQPGYLNKEGYRQKPYLEFYCNKKWFPYLLELEKDWYLFHVSDYEEQTVYQSSNLTLPFTITQTLKRKIYTRIPDSSTINSTFKTNFNEDENFGLIDCFLVQMVYPKFTNKDLFQDLLNWVIDFNKYLEMIEELKSNCRFIALCGKLGSGKDYLADNYITPKLSNKSLKLAFADQIKINSIVNMQADPKKIFGKRDKTTRELMQKSGTEFGRNVYGDNIWLKYFLVWIYLHYKQNNILNFIITDCRFMNEYNIVKILNGTIIKVYSPLRTKQKKEQEGLTDEHLSEAYVDKIPYDFLINNDPGNIIDFSFL